jgi:2'-5' RNA ligase
MLPEEFTDRRQARPGAPDFTDSVCWHLLLGDQEPVRAMAREAQQRLAGFTGLHMTPLRWLHATVLLVGPAGNLTQADMDQMLTKARRKLDSTAPPTVALGRVIYHPEGILLPLTSSNAMAPIFEAAQAATREVTGNSGVTSIPGPSWMPHVTLCYSISQQTAAPIITALGKALPVREVAIDKLTLVIQHGPALSWDWHPVGTVNLGQGDGIKPVSSLGESTALYALAVHDARCAANRRSVPVRNGPGIATCSSESGAPYGHRLCRGPGMSESSRLTILTRATVSISDHCRGAASILP